MSKVSHKASEEQDSRSDDVKAILASVNGTILLNESIPAGVSFFPVQGSSPSATQNSNMKGVDLSCLETLRFSEFRDKMLSKFEKGNTMESANSTTSGQPGSQDSVFKSLSSKIKNVRYVLC